MNENSNLVTTLKLAEPKRVSIKSFWFATAGLAIIAHVVTLGTSHLVMSNANLISWIVMEILESLSQEVQFSQLYWRSVEAVANLVGTALTPSVVVACVVPILYWRGHLAQRFLVSVVIAVTVLNVAGNVEPFPRRLTANWVELAMIVACWISLPVLFTWTPVKTRQLRLIVASGVMLMTLCISILHMYQAQQNEFFLGWMALYAAAFSFALLRRNWGRVTMTEAGTQAEDIQTTSTRTLLELMAVSGLACSAASFWSTRIDMNSAFLFAGSAVFGLVIAMISMSLIRFTFEPVTFRIPKLLMIWLATALLFSCNLILISILEITRYGVVTAQQAQAQGFLGLVLVIVAASIVGSFLYVLLTLAIGIWLRWCGWSIVRAPTKLNKAVASFSELL